MRNVREYFRPKTVDEALRLISRGDVRSRCLLGAALTSEDSPGEVESLIDLGNLGLGFVRPEGTGLRLGGMTGLQVLIESPEAASFASGALIDAARRTTSRLQRNQLSLTAALLSERCSRELAILLVLLEAEALIQRLDGTTTLPLGDLYADLEACIDGAILTELFVPGPPPGNQIHQCRVARTRADRAILAVAALTSLDAGRIRSARIAAGGISLKPARLGELEGVLVGLPAEMREVSSVVRHSLAPMTLPDDSIAGEDYRRSVLEALVVRALLGD